MALYVRKTLFFSDKNRRRGFWLKYQKKSHITRKKHKGGPFGLSSTVESITKPGLVLDSNPDTNKTGTSKVGAISKAQKAQSFLNMPRMYS